MDNEPRHPDTIKRMKKPLKGKLVCLDNAPWHTKDINEMIKTEGQPQQIESYMADNVLKG